MIKFTARIVVVAGAALLVAAFGLPTYSAHASGQSCQESVNLDTCDYVNGSGLHVNYVRGTTQNLAASVQHNLHLEISGPHGLIKNCAQVNLGGGATMTCTWSPNANEPAGNYCTDLWQYSGGRYTDRGHACVNVHS
jgi:hypothetical protein